MRLNYILKFVVALSLSLSLLACKEEKEEFAGELAEEYMPLEVGKYITYRIDSLVFIDFDQTPVTRSYQVKHVVDAETTDNNGRKTFRIYRYINDANAAGDWTPNGTYFITPTRTNIELVEDNLRFVKLQSPVREGFSWKGNSYLPLEPYSAFGHNFSNDDDMQNWEYYYQPFESSVDINGQTYENVFSVEVQYDFSNVPVMDPISYGYINRINEKYSKGIGLVYRDYTMWEYQPSGAAPYYSGFGVTMWMIDHN